MGLLRLIKRIREQRKREKQCLTFGLNELTALSDQELFEVLEIRLMQEEDKIDVSGCLTEFKGSKRIFYIINYFDSEVQNGGLCQFFVNLSREVAPWLLDNLATIGAVQYKTLLESFITKYCISMEELSSFIIEDEEEFEEQEERYPYDEFDDAFYELYEKTPLDQILLNYVKCYLEDFV